MADTKPSEQGKQEGIEESQQDRKQDETAKQRPAQTDRSSAGPQPRSAASCDTALGSFTEKRKPAGTLAAQRS